MDLRTAVERLEDAYEADRARLVDEGHAEPELVQSADGRFVLLDALAAIVNGRAALATAAKAPAYSNALDLRPGARQPGRTL